jgi:multiple sugar transport system permease protein
VRTERYLLVPFILLPTFFLIIISLYPLAYSVMMSFYRGLLQQFIGFKNYTDMLADDRFYAAIYVTFAFTSVTVGSEVLLGLLLAGCLTLFPIKKASWWQTVYIVPLAVPPVVSGVIWKILYHPSFGPLSLLGVLGLPVPDPLGQPNVAIFSVSLINIWMWTPFAFLVFYAGMRAVRQETIEGALIDGASKFQIFRNIILPSIRTLILVVIFWRFTANLTAFDEIMGSTEGGPGFATTTLTIFAYWIGFKSWDMGYAATAAIYLLLIVAVVGGILFKRLGIIRE